MLNVIDQLELLLEGGEAVRPSQKAGPDDFSTEGVVHRLLTKPCHCYPGECCIWEINDHPIDEPCFNMVASYHLSGDEPEPEPDDFLK